MSFRIKLFLAFALSIGGAVALVSWTVSSNVRKRFAQHEEQRSQALIAQFQREFFWRSSDVERRVEGIADSDSIARLGVELNRAEADYSLWVNEAQSLAQTQDLDFLELVADDGTIISSAHWPARFGYRNDWISHWDPQRDFHAFLEPIELPEEVVLAIIAVRTVQAREKRLFVIGGLRLDKDFLFTLTLPEGMRVLLYRNLEASFSDQWLTGAAGVVSHGEVLEPLIKEVQQTKKESKNIIAWTSDPGDSETFQAIPLFGREHRLLGILLVGNSRRELVALTSYIRKLASAVGAGGVLLGLMLAWWVSLQVSRPVQKLSHGARQVAAGNWQTRVDITRKDEIGRLATAFNEMTRQLIDQRERLVQAERVAAWRELARRLAHELKNPLFPLQITVENLQRAKQQHPEEFDEVFSESTQTLLSELGALRTIINRFSEFAKMPAPQLEPVNLNQIVERVLCLFESQFQGMSNKQFRVQIELDPKLAQIQADPEQLARALQNLILNALDAMPEGGTLSLRTRGRDGSAILEVADSGCGLTREECERLFTPYYTTKQQGTGLGLAIVQSVVSDHGGRISVESTPGRGTTFCIELPERVQV